MTSTGETPAQRAPVEIAAALAEDCARLSAVAQAAKAHWDYPAAWLEAWRHELTFTGETLHTQEVYVARLNGEIQGLCALKADSEEETTQISLEHLWVHPDAMGYGLGRRLFEHAVQRARQLGMRRIELWADPNAASFYEHLGARHVGDHHGDVLGLPRILPIYAVDIDSADIDSADIDSVAT